MNLLALDTSSLACSVALQVEDDTFSRHEEQPREHTRLLVPMIKEVFASGGIASSDLDAIVLGNGPGSFIGMRIATSVAQGMAYAGGIKIVPVSSLLAVAAEVMVTDEAGHVAVCQDAHMNEVLPGSLRGWAPGYTRARRRGAAARSGFDRRTGEIAPSIRRRGIRLATLSGIGRHQRATAGGHERDQVSVRALPARCRSQAARARRGGRAAGRGPGVPAADSRATASLLIRVTNL